MVVRGGRGAGFSSAHIDKMLDEVEKRLPIGMDEWDDLALQVNSQVGNNQAKTADSYKNKFKALKNKKKPTGNALIPPHNLRAKR